MSRGYGLAIALVSVYRSMRDPVVWILIGILRYGFVILIRQLNYLN